MSNLRAAVKAKPKYPAAWNNLGVALRKVGDLDGAVTAPHVTFLLVIPF